jgi:hypothetical protein
MSNNTNQDPLWLQRWKQEGIRYLGKDETGHIDHMDRWEQSYKTGHTDGVAEGKHEAIELCIGLLYHQYQTIKTFHGKEAEMSLLLKNCILEIRNAQAQEMEK